MKSDQFNPGYNVVEKDLLNEYPFIPEKELGLIEFLRILRTGQKIDSHIRVLGLDSVLFKSEKPEETCKVIRNILSKAREDIPPGLIIVFPIDAELRNHNPRIFKDSNNVKLNHLFGNRIQKEVSGRAHSSFNIEPG